MDVLSTLFYFIVAIGVLVSIHEFGHFWVARKMGVKVIRFSIGFGKILWSYQSKPGATEYAVAAIPLGGYVKMVDEREGEVDIKDLDFAFNRQSVWARIAIVSAGPIANLLLAVLLLWLVFMLGETGLRPVLGRIDSGTLAEQAGLVRGEEIIAVDGIVTPTWSNVMEKVFAAAIDRHTELNLTIKNLQQDEEQRLVQLPTDLADEPEKLYEKLGFAPWIPEMQPIIGGVLPASAAEQAGLKAGDLIISADGVAIEKWMQWVEYVKNHPDSEINVIIEREDVHLPITVVPKKITVEGVDVGKIGASVFIQDDLFDSLQVTVSLPVGPALLKAFDKTQYYSMTTLTMMGRMLMGSASVKNLSGPVSIAQYAGQSAELGLVHFLKFLALISISLGVINLLPVPVLDGGHLMFYLIEIVKGSPVPDKVQAFFQAIGIALLVSLMVFAMFLDLGRIFQ